MKPAIGMLLVGVVAFQSGFAADTTASKSDVKYVRESAQGLMSELELGALAQDHAGDPRVKDFGKQMVTDHGKDLDRLKALATKMNIALPSAMTEDQQEESNKLGKMSGKAFDHEYVQYEAKDHRDDIKEQTKQLKATTNADLKQFARAELATVTGHKREVDALRSQIK